MSNEAGSSKGKEKMYSDNEETLTSSSSPSVLSGLTSEDLSSFHTFLQNYGQGSLENLMKQQQTAEWLQEQRKIRFRKSETGESSQKTTEGSLEGFKISNLDSNAEKEELDQPIKSLKGKCKWIKYSDDHRKEVTNETDNKTEEKIQSSSPLVPSVLTSEELSYFHTAYECDGRRGSLADYIKQQQEALQLWEQMNASEIYFTDSDSEDEELDPMEELIFELEISDTNHLVIPYETASDHFPDLMLKTPITDETLLLTDPLGRDWKMTLTYDGDTHSYVITQGLSLYLEHYHINPPAMIQIYLPLPQLHANHFYIQHQKNLGRSLFELQVPHSNRLPIPCDLAVKYFNPSKAPPPPDHLQEYPLHLTDHLNKTWEMRFVCFEDEEAYVVVRGWEHYVANYGLKHNDTIRFFRQNPSPNGNGNCFIIYHEKKLSFSTNYICPPLCLQMNLLCELDLRKEDVELGRLEMPGVEIPFECREKDMVKLTDADSNDWYVMIVQQSVSREYMIVDGWEGIVRGHELEAEDTVRFYIPACPDHDRHFLITCAKKKAEREIGRGSGKHDAGPVSRKSASCKGKEKLYIC